MFGPTVPKGLSNTFDLQDTRKGKNYFLGKPYEILFFWFQRPDRKEKYPPAHSSQGSPPLVCNGPCSFNTLKHWSSLDASGEWLGPACQYESVTMGKLETTEDKRGSISSLSFCGGGQMKQSHLIKCWPTHWVR